MLKRTIAWVIALTLLMSLVPQMTLGVTAEGEIPAAHSHSASQHNCEHCEEAITWTAWEKTDSLPSTSGHYYLTGDVKPAGQTKLTGSADVVLCLNGYTIDIQKKSTIFYVQDTAKLTVTDCTAYTDTEGVFHAGVIKNGSAGGAMSGAIYAKNNCQIALYNCIFSGNVLNYLQKSSAEGFGGAVQLRGDKAGTASSLYMENVLFEDNTSGVSAGAVCVIGSKTVPTVTAKNCTFKNNTAVNGGAVYLRKANATFTECLFEGNTSKGGTLDFQGTKKTLSGGTIRLDAATVMFDKCEMINNTAQAGGGVALHLGGEAGASTATLKDCTVTGNTSTPNEPDFRGAVYVPNKTSKLTLTGKTVIDGNTKNDKSGNPVECNVYLQVDVTGQNPVDVGGLANGASVSIYTRNLILTEATMVTAATAPAKWSSAWVLYENNGMAVDYNETDKFHFVENLVHEHCVCGVTGCANENHEKVLFQPWTDTDALPADGCYYLTEDVKLTAEAAYTGDVTLCLNGHTVTQTKADTRVIGITAGTVRITGCKGGTITGGKIPSGGGGGICVNGKEAKLELYNVTVTGNQSSSVGGGIHIMGGAEATLTNVTVSDNTATNNGGGIALRETGSKLTVTGGTITGNTASKDGGGIYAQAGTELTATDVEVSGNTVTNGKAGGGVAVSGKAALTNLTVKNNKAGSGAGMIFQGSSDSVMTGGTVSGNEGTGSGGGIYAAKKVTLNGVTVTDNTAKNSGSGVYVAATDVLTLTGETVINGNNGSNLYLSSTTNVIFDKLTGKAYIGIGVKDNAARAISGQTAQDPTAYLFSGSADLQPAYKDGIVYLEAAVKHTHCLCSGEGTGCDHAALNYAKWDKTDSLPTSGNYYLENDVVLTAEQSITGNLNLCLNGKTVKAADGKRHLSTVKNQGVTIVISDCTASYAADGTYSAGKFTGGRDLGGNAGGGSAYIRAGSTLKIYDGIFTDNSSYLQGGAICMADGTSFEMHGGEISDNQAVSIDGKTWKKGGGLCVYNCTTTITGGTIKNNKGSNGGAIAGFSKSAITITGGTVEGNWSNSDGGGLYVNGAGLYVSGSAVVKNNESRTAGGNLCYGGNSYGSVSDIAVEGGSASGGGGVIVQNGAKVTMTDVTFKNNNASNLAGAVRVYKATLTMTGCTVTGNTAKNVGGITAENSTNLTLTDCTVTGNSATDTVGGVRVDSSSGLTLSGKNEIAENEGGNLLLMGGALMEVSGLTGGEIWISADMGPISKPCEDLSQYFKSESVYRGVIYKDGALYMATDGSHKHCFCLGDATECDHAVVEWVAWESTTSLPSSGSYYLLNDIVLTAEQSITEDVNICLNGKTVKAAEGKRHISTVKNDEAHIVICDCTAKTENGVYTAGKLTGGVDVSGNTGGGSIYLRAGGFLELYDGIITGNTTTTAGGALCMNSGADFTMHSGELSGNTAFKTTLDENGAEVITWKAGGGIYSGSGNTVKLLGGTICDNEGGEGGGVRFAGKGELILGNVTITDNSAHGQGGGAMASSTTVTIDGVKITGNTTTSSAGGLCLGTGAVATMTSGTISGNSAVTGGGVILQGSAKLTMNGGKISGNTAGSNGGGIALYSKAELHMYGGEVSGNTSQKDGGGIYANKAGVYLYDKALISGNTVAKSHGGGISYGGSSYGKISGGIIEKNQSYGGGGLMIQNKAEVEITGGTIQNNSAVKNGGGGIWAYKSTLTMTGGTVKNNTAKVCGGGISITDSSVANISNVSVTGSTSKKDGAGIYVTKATLNIRGGVTSSYNYTDGNGGGVCYGSKSSGYISGLSAYNNTTKGGGAGMIIQNQANVSIGYAYIANNEGKQGSGIWVYKAGLTMNGGKIVGNTALTGAAGAIYATNATKLEMSNVTISKNASIKTSGGAIYLNQSKLVMKDSVISDNESLGSGTGIMVTGGTWNAELAGADLTNVKITGNRGGAKCSGAAMYVNTDVEVFLTDCEIADNTTELHCGGIYAASGAVPTLKNCKLVGNEAAQNGGALYAGDTGYVENCYFADNKADKGAGIFAGNYMERWACNGWGNKRLWETGMTIIGCTFEGNDAVTDGGGFHLDMSCYTVMDDCTFTGNTAGVNGAAMWLWENCTMTDLTVTGNICANNGHALYLADSEFDGQTYINGLFKMGGDMIIKDNEGGDLYLDYKTTIGIIMPQGYGPKTHMVVTLDEGLLTQRVDGAYNYEGGDLVYTLTYGDRSLTEPEYDPSLVKTAADETQEQTKDQGTEKKDIWLYVGVGAVALVILAAAVLILKKKKTKPEAANKD